MASGCLTPPWVVQLFFFGTALGDKDLVAIGRPHLSNPYWTLHEATKIGDRAAKDWPNPYLAGRDQAWRLADREKEIVKVE